MTATDEVKGIDPVQTFLNTKLTEQITNNSSEYHNNSDNISVTAFEFQQRQPIVNEKSSSATELVSHNRGSLNLPHKKAYKLISRRSIRRPH